MKVNYQYNNSYCDRLRYRLCTILEEWDNDDCRIDVIEEKVIQDMKIKLGLSKSEIHEIENEISGSTGQATPEYGESRRVSIVNFGPKKYH